SDDEEWMGIVAQDIRVVLQDLSWPLILSLEPAVSPLIGRDHVVYGTNFDQGSVIAVDNVTISPNLTRWVYPGLISFVSPPRSTPGYAALQVINPDGGSATSLDLLYYATGCAAVGLWGSDDNDCFECPEGASCPGGNRLRPEPGYWNHGEDSSYVYKCL